MSAVSFEPIYSTEVRVSFWSPQNVVLVTLAIFGVFLGIYYYWQQKSRFCKLGNAIPGPPGIPLIGNVLDVLINPDREYFSNRLKFPIF